MTRDRRVWVLVRHAVQYHEEDIVAVTASLDGAQKAAAEDYGEKRPALEWVQQPNESWTTVITSDVRYTADQWEVTP